MEIKTYTTETIVNTVHGFRATDTILTDDTVIRDIMFKFKPECKNVTYKSRKELHDCIKAKQPNILILLKYSEKTFKFTSEVSPNTQIYVLETDEDEKRISRYVDELEEMA